MMQKNETKMKYVSEDKFQQNWLVKADQECKWVLVVLKGYLDFGSP